LRTSNRSKSLPQTILLIASEEATKTVDACTVPGVVQTIEEEALADPIVLQVGVIVAAAEIERRSGKRRKAKGGTDVAIVVLARTARIILM